MVWLQQQTHKQPEYKALKIDKPGFGGLNIKDLDFMLRPDESPKMQNMMVKNGVFKKRHGQKRMYETGYTWADAQTWATMRPVMFEFHEKLYLMNTYQADEHKYTFNIGCWDGANGTNVLSLDGTDTTNGTFLYKANPDPDSSYYKRTSYEVSSKVYNTGFFFVSDGTLYCIASYPGYDGTSFDGKFFRFYVFAKLNEETGQFEMQSIDDMYVPTVAINCRPDISYYDVEGLDQFNLLCPRARIEYNGDGSSKTYKIPKELTDEKMGYAVKVEIDEEEVSPSTYSVSFGQVVFNSAPVAGQDNVAITVSTVQSGNAFSDYSYLDLASEILSAQFSTPFGGTNNSRLFVGGSSERYYYSYINDPTYFQAMDYGVAGYDGERITGFGHHYKDLIVFKANSIYTLKYQYGADSNGEMQGLIYSQPVNLDIGCDAPNTIRKINNRLTWLSTKYGVCTLVSTVLEDERNVCVVSRNIERGERVKGLLDEANEYSFAQDYDGKYILFNNIVSKAPVEGVSEKDRVPVLSNVYVWDYAVAPFFLSEKQSAEDSARNTSWYVWNNFSSVAAKRFRNEVYTLDYRYTDDFWGLQLSKWIDDENDFGEPIEAYYQTPMFDFGQYGYLKTVKKIFVQCRGGITYNTTLKYLTDENDTGETEPENLISTSSVLWDDFSYANFAWGETPFANTFARKCSLKKIELAGVMFSNNITNNDMPINGLQMLYTLVKEIK